MPKHLPHLAIRQLTEKLLYNQELREHLAGIDEPWPAQERAVLFLAVRDTPATVMLWMLTESASIMEIFHIYSIYLDEQEVLAEARGECNLDEKYARWRSETKIPWERGSVGWRKLKQMVARAETGEKDVWEAGFIEQILDNGTAREIELLAAKAPLTARQFVMAKRTSGWKSIYANHYISIETIEKVLSKDNIYPEIVGHIMDRYDPTTNKSDLPAELFEKCFITAKAHPRVLRKAMAPHNRHLLTKALWQEILDTDHEGVLSQMAEQEGLPEEMYLALAEHPSLEVQSALYGNTGLGDEIRERLALRSPIFSAGRIAERVKEGVPLTREELKAGLTSPFKGVRLQTIRYGVGNPKIDNQEDIPKGPKR